MKPMLKICGLMRAEDVRMCCEMGVDICGFVTEYPLAVPWNLRADRCRELLRAVVAPTKSCIVTGGGREAIIARALALRPDYVQLHYRETLDDTAEIVRALSPHGIGVIKTVPTTAAERAAQFGDDDPAVCARQLGEAGVSLILVDSRGPSNAADGGGTADLRLYGSIRDAAGCPVMLGGGIRAENCREIIDTLHPDILDVMTGVESTPGKKSRARLTELIRHIKA